MTNFEKPAENTGGIMSKLSGDEKLRLAAVGLAAVGAGGFAANAYRDSVEVAQAKEDVLDQKKVEKEFGEKYTELLNLLKHGDSPDNLLFYPHACDVALGAIDTELDKSIQASTSEAAKRTAELRQAREILLRASELQKSVSIIQSIEAYFKDRSDTESAVYVDLKFKTENLLPVAQEVIGQIEGNPTAREFLAKANQGESSERGRNYMDYNDYN